jgi:hypothetical protein
MGLAAKPSDDYETVLLKCVNERQTIYDVILTLSGLHWRRRPSFPFIWGTDYTTWPLTDFGVEVVHDSQIGFGIPYILLLSNASAGHVLKFFPRDTVRWLEALEHVGVKVCDRLNTRRHVIRTSVRNYFEFVIGFGLLLVVFLLGWSTSLR